jgi:NADP-dependent 3-hydroxy acid dehydrogenase YdfG
MSRLQNKIALITGASACIGRAPAKLFAAEGAKLVVGAQRETEPERQRRQSIQP